MNVGFSLEELDQIVQDIARANYELPVNLRQAALDAADKAIEAMQSSHPYEDQTYNLSGGMQAKPGSGRDAKGRFEGGAVGEAIITFTARYANILDDPGWPWNSPGKYNFSHIGLEAAEPVLEAGVEDALREWIRTVLGG